MKNVIIILNYNDYMTTEKLVDSIKNYKCFEKIILVDNASTDNSFSLLEKKYKEIEKIDVIKNQENKGYASGNNFGGAYAIKKYNPQYIYISNPDVYFKEDVIYKIEETFKSNEKIGAIAPVVSTGNNSWKVPNYTRTLASMFILLGKIIGNKPYKNKKYGINYVDVLEGSFFAIRASIFREINGFDERTFLYYEENIIAFKLRKAGYYSVLITNCTYDHNHSVTINKTYKSKLKIYKILGKSIKIYNYDYLKINSIQKAFLKFIFAIAYLEKIIIDMFNKIKYRNAN